VRNQSRRSGESRTFAQSSAQRFQLHKSGIRPTWTALERQHLAVGRLARRKKSVVVGSTAIPSTIGHGFAIAGKWSKNLVGVFVHVIVLASSNANALRLRLYIAIPSSVGLGDVAAPSQGALRSTHHVVQPRKPPEDVPPSSVLPVTHT